MNLLVGCPVLHREWILDRWFDYVLHAALKAGFDEENLSFVFVGDPVKDPETWEIIRRRDPLASEVWVPDPRPRDKREWKDSRYRRMVFLRNSLLQQVRLEAPDLFLSLDSDVLLHKDALTRMIELSTAAGGLYDAVGSRCYLHARGTKCPSWANLSKLGQLQRSDTEGTHRVDCIFAIKLMTPAAYAVDYRNDTQGEDTGWAKNVKAAGLKLGYTGEVASKHVMDPKFLDVVDERIGW